MADKKTKQVKESKGTDKLTELKEQVKKAKKELSDLQMDLTQNKLKNTSSVTLKRKEIAKLLTAQRLVELHEKNA